MRSLGRWAIGLALLLLSTGCRRFDACVVVFVPEEAPRSFPGLQAALDLAPENAVVQVCATPPRESVTVHRSVQITAPRGAVIEGPAGAPTLLVEADGPIVVVLENLEIRGPAAGAQAALAMRGPASVWAGSVWVHGGVDPEPLSSDFQGLVDIEGGSIALHDSEVTWEGAGAALAARSGANVQIDASTLASAGGAVVSLSGADATLEDTSIAGPASRGIDMVGGALTLRDVRVASVTEDGVHVEGSAVSADDLFVSDAGHDGVAIVGGTLRIEGATIVNSGSNGLVATASEGSVDETSIETTGRAGFVSALSDLELGFVTLQSAGTNGLEVLGGTVHVERLTSRAHGRNGVLVGAEAFVTCADCVLEGGVEGVRVSEGSVLAVEGTQILQPVSYGISVRDESQVRMENSEIHGAFTGIHVDDTYADCTVMGSLIADSAGPGVALAAGRLTFSASSVTGSAEEGLLVSGGSVTVADASFDDNLSDGIRLGGDAHAQIQATARRNLAWGLYCDGGAEDPYNSSVVLDICALAQSDNALGAVSLQNGCQQDQFCTVSTP